MSLTSNEIIMIATPGLVTLMAGMAVCLFDRDRMRLRAARKAGERYRDDVRSTATAPLVVQLTADESAVVRKMIERDMQARETKDRPIIVSAPAR